MKTFVGLTGIGTGDGHPELSGWAYSFIKKDDFAYGYDPATGFARRYRWNASNAASVSSSPAVIVPNDRPVGATGAWELIICDGSSITIPFNSTTNEITPYVIYWENYVLVVEHNTGITSGLEYIVKRVVDATETERIYPSRIYESSDGNTARLEFGVELIGEYVLDIVYAGWGVAPYPDNQSFGSVVIGAASQIAISSSIPTDVEINAALGSVKNLTLEPITHNLSAKIIIPPFTKLSGSGHDTILDVSGISSGESIVLGEGASLENIKIVGSISPLSNITRKIICGDHSRVKNVWISNNGYGIDTEGAADVKIDDVRFDNIYSSDTWAACIHAGAGSENIKVNGIYIDSSDRGIEVENGAKNIEARNGWLRNVKVTGGYSFVLDAHTHTGLGVTKNVLYENFYLENCDSITADGFDSTDYVENITYRNIIINSPYFNTLFNVYIDNARDVTLDNIRIYGDAWSNEDVLNVSYSENVSILSFTVENGQKSRIQFPYSAGCRISKCSFSRPSSTTEYTVRVSSADGVSMTGLYIGDVSGWGGLQIDNNCTMNISDSEFRPDATNPGSYGIYSQGVDMRIYDNRFVGFASSKVAVRLLGNNARVYNNDCSGKIWVNSGVTGSVIYDNYLPDGYTDDGTGTTFRDNT